MAAVPNPPPIQQESDRLEQVPTKEETPGLAAPDLEPLAAGDPYKHAAPHEDQAPGSEAWTAFDSVAQKYDRNTCDVWKSEIDNLLLFASLFSAVATAFVIESYKLLQVDHQEVASAVLRGIHNQLDNIVRQNTTAPTLIPDPTPQFTPPRSAVAINICFFLSLTLSLSTVSVGILCLQWLREYRRESEVSPQQMIAIRYFRLRGIERWGVREIVGLLPVALQLALFIFLVGLAVLLWSTNQTVAIVVCCAIGITIVIYGVTSIIPAFRAFLHILTNPDGDHSLCPYRSPQAWFARRFSLAMGMSIAYLLEEIGKRLPYFREVLTAEHNSDGTVSGWSAVTQQLKARFDSNDWVADDVRHIGERNDAWSRMAVAWGIASIPGVHHHNVRALCAMIRCIDGMEPDQSVMVLERMDAGRSSNLVKMLREATVTDTVPSDAPNRVMAQCMVLAHIVDRLADSNDHIRLLTLNYRFELYLRILNQYARDFALVDPSEPPDLEMTQNRGKWWSLVQTQAHRLFHIYRLGNMKVRGSVSEDLEIEIFKTTCRYIEQAPFGHVEYILLSSPLAELWLLPTPSTPAVIAIGDAVNARLKGCIDSLVSQSSRKHMLSNVILYALRMSKRGIEHSESFISLVRAIPEIDIPIPLQASPKGNKLEEDWERLAKNLRLPEVETVGGEKD